MNKLEKEEMVQEVHDRERDASWVSDKGLACAKFRRKLRGRREVLGIRSTPAAIGGKRQCLEFSSLP